jgi:aerobic carbon-monoxide dehydrogenase medium subunit
MKAAPFSYHAPRSLEEALDLLSRLENARLLAGGQSLMPMLAYRLAMPDHLIDLGNIDTLRGIRCTADGLIIGAMTTQRAIEKSELVAEYCPLLVEALEHVGHQATRNRGTIGGSLCHLDPASELPLVAQVLQPTLTIASRRGLRNIPFAEFPLGQLTNQLEADEILISVAFSHPPANTRFAFQEFARRLGDFAIVAAAVQLTFTDEAVVTDARIAVSGIDPVAVRLPDVEAAILDRFLNPEQIGFAAEHTAMHKASGDHNNSAEYRQHLAKVLTSRALTQARARFVVTNA